jgi:hypothetical protein
LIADLVNSRWVVEISPKDVSIFWDETDIIKVENSFLMDVHVRGNTIVLTGAVEDYPVSSIVSFDISNATKQESKSLYVNLSADERPTFGSYSTAYRFIDSIPRTFRTSQDIIISGSEDWVEMDYPAPTRTYPTENEWNSYWKNFDSNQSDVIRRPQDFPAGSLSDYSLSDSKFSNNSLISNNLSKSSLSNYNPDDYSIGYYSISSYGNDFDTSGKFLKAMPFDDGNWVVIIDPKVFFSDWVSGSVVTTPPAELIDSVFDAETELLTVFADRSYMPGDTVMMSIFRDVDIDWTDLQDV